MNLSATARFPRSLFKRYARISRLIATGGAALGLIALRWDDIVKYRHADMLVFAGIILLAILYEGYLIGAPYFASRLERKTDTELRTQNEVLYFPANLFYKDRSTFRMFFLWIVLLACFILTFRLLQEPDAVVDNLDLVAVLAAIMLYFFGITFFARIQHIALKSFIFGHYWQIWAVLCLAIGAVMGAGLFAAGARSLFVVFGASITGASISWIVYVDNRLGVNDRVWSEVVQSLSMNLMRVGTIRGNRNYVVDLIGRRLRYERVFLLEPTPDRRELRVTAEFGDYPSVENGLVPSTRGITGRAFNNGKTYAWNDINDCPYYYQLVSQMDDTTRAEIAIPIQYRGEIYGVLDVQSKHAMVYAPADITSLETIATILGMSIAIDNADTLLGEANNLWNQLSQDGPVESEAFHLIADFGRNKLGADVVIYYPLSPTGHPFKPPSVVGELLEPDQMTKSVSSLSSPLIRLIDEWIPQFEPNLNPNSIFSHQGALPQPSFTEREKIRSVCFIPIGTQKEKLGIVFLNYRRRHEFDSIYRLTVMAFAQALATLASKARYRQIVFDGFGRPDLGVHNIQAKYGLKEGVLSEGKRVFATTCRTVFQVKNEVQDCGMFNLLRNVDHFLTEVRAQTTVEFDIWNRTLREAFQDFTRRMKEQPNNRHLWFITDLDSKIERESIWTKLALYRVMTEAVNNAIFHGHATEIEILAQRREKCIYLKVMNNGTPLPPQAHENKSRGGVFTLLNELKSQFGAFYSLMPTEKGGTILEAEIPTLPLKTEVNLV